MKLRTGDILVWRLTHYNDLIGEHTIGLPGFHCGLILHGDHLTQNGSVSKTHTYIIFSYQIYPIEYVLEKIWKSRNGSSCYIIHRTNGENIPLSKTKELIKYYFSFPESSSSIIVYSCILSFFNISNISPIYNNKYIKICSFLIAYMLKNMGLIHDTNKTNNLLPMDYYDLRFYQKYNYIKVCIFDKKICNYEWWLTSLTIALGWFHPDPMFLDFDTLLQKFPCHSECLVCTFPPYNTFPQIH